MSRSHLWSALSSVPRRSAFPDISSGPVFRKILSRECARSDRTGRGFSLVVFETGGGGRRSGFLLLRQLAQALARRVRESDATGWLDEERVAALLPATPVDGARVFVEDLRAAMGPCTPVLSCTVHAYPCSSTTGPPPENAPARDASPVPGFRIPLWKRALDVSGALLALLLFSPLFAAVALLIRIVSPGPVFFKQERIGHMGKPFTFWKFRTMHVNNDPSEHRKYLSELIRGDRAMVKLDEGRDPRIIPFGRFLRQTCLDELPQLFNVLEGTMSLVGPRPCLPYEAREYEPWHRRRFDVLPGMTGLWQVSGKNRTTFQEMIRFDMAYVRNVSFFLDVKILLKTVSVVLGLTAEHFTKSALAVPDGVTDPAPERLRAESSIPREGPPPRHDERRNS